MSLVILIENPDKLDDYIERDMRRWWRHNCKKHVADSETWFEIRDFRTWATESIKRLASFGIKARVVRRFTP